MEAYHFNDLNKKWSRRTFKAPTKMFRYKSLKLSVISGGRASELVRCVKSPFPRWKISTVDDLLRIQVDPSGRNILGNERKLFALLSQRKKRLTTLCCWTTTTPAIHDSDRKNRAVASPSFSFTRSACAAEVASCDSSFPLKNVFGSLHVTPSSEAPYKCATTLGIRALECRASICHNHLCSVWRLLNVHLRLFFCLLPVWTLLRGLWRCSSLPTPALFFLDPKTTMRFCSLRARPPVEELRICYNSNRTFLDLPFWPL